MFGHDHFGKPFHTFPDHALLFGHDLFGKPLHTFPGHALFGHDLFGKPFHTFPDHALVRRTSGMEQCVAGRFHPRQLAFALPHAESLTRDNFLEGPANEAGLSLISAWPEWPSRTMLLTGPEGSGKSHLAAIWAETAGARSTSAHALSPVNVPAALATGALVVEDLNPGAFDERALFHLLNLAREEEAYILITARLSPSAFNIELRDLSSRLRALPAISLLEPDDQLLRALIVKFCADRQLAVDETVVSYLVPRIERSYAAARAAVELLDRESLRLGRPVTRALAAELLRKP